MDMGAQVQQFDFIYMALSKEDGNLVQVDAHSVGFLEGPIGQSNSFTADRQSGKHSNVPREGGSLRHRSCGTTSSRRETWYPA